MGYIEEKEVYNHANYKYFVDTHHKPNTYYASDMIDIGTDIAGSIYDVATIHMKGTWRMPSISQLKELVANCRCYNTYNNGVKGYEIIGPNHGIIFIPAASSRWDEVPKGNYDGISCSTLREDGNKGKSMNEYYLRFNRFEIENIWRSAGCTVRAVCP